MDSNSSDHDELGWSWAGHEERKKMMMQLQLQFQLQLRDEFCGAYSTDYESAEELPVPPPQFSAATATKRNSGGSMSHLIEIEKQKVGDDMAMGNWWSFTNGPSMCFSDVPISQAEAEEQGSVGAMREMIFRMAAMQPIEIDPEVVKPPKRRNVKISKDPQSVAARHRRERISHRIRILQRLVPGGTKMDTASMLDEAIHYLKFLKSQLHSLQRASSANRPSPLLMSCATPTPNSNSSYLPMHNPPSHPPHPHLHHHIN